MTIHSAKKLANKKMQIDLTGPDGNAFVLLGIANRFCKDFKYSTTETRKIKDDMMSGDYEHLLKVFEENFGDYVDMYR